MKKRVFIVHGWGGNPQEGWFPWLKRELENKDFLVEIPSMPDTENPKIETWIPYLTKSVGLADENTFFVGHSIGCQTILRYLESLPENVRVGGAVFVAGFFSAASSTITGLTDEEKKIIAPWLNTPIVSAKIRQHTNKFIAIFSDNDSFVPMKNKKIFEQELGAKTTVEHQKNHFSGDDGVDKLPIALNSLLSIAE